jgi:hypothetical protein
MDENFNEEDQNIYSIINDQAIKEKFIKNRTNFQENFTKKYSTINFEEYDYDKISADINEDYRMFLTEIAEVLGSEKFKKIFRFERSDIPKFQFPNLGTF